MRELVVVSGKGGTGKTSITAALVAIARNPVIADCDVDAPNLHLLLRPKIQKAEEFIASKIAIIDSTLCKACGVCETACRFEAISTDYEVHPVLCEGCGVCYVSCPYNAIHMQERLSGYVYTSDTEYGPMAHALLLAGESNSGKLVTRVRELAAELAKMHGKNLIFVDGSPGIACSAISAIKGATAGLVITEPTKAAIHDMERVLELFHHFKLPVMVIINKADLNLHRSKKIRTYCQQQNVPLVGEIPYDPIMYKAVVAGQSIIDFAPSCTISKNLKTIWNTVEQQLGLIEQT
ncbi:MAG: ATP-binding protein [Candidatus Thorarchaeota archaeon]